MHEITTLSADELQAALPEFGRLMHACVEAGASVGYVLPWGQAEAERFWTAKVSPGLKGGGLVLLAARIDGRLAGTVQLDCDTPPNQPHRAEVRKLLVHPEVRRQGIARALMLAVEPIARARGKTLLTLDTRTGDAAEPLYASLGYLTAGVLPGWCVDALDPNKFDATTFMYKAL